MVFYVISLPQTPRFCFHVCFSISTEFVATQLRLTTLRRSLTLTHSMRFCSIVIPFYSTYHFCNYFLLFIVNITIIVIFIRFVNSSCFLYFFCFSVFQCSSGISSNEPFVDILVTLWATEMLVAGEALGIIVAIVVVGVVIVVIVVSTFVVRPK